MCINQAFRPKFRYHTEDDGWGDCRYCTRDERNKECKGYRPITMYKFQVVGDDNES